MGEIPNLLPSPVSVCGEIGPHPLAALSLEHLLPWRLGGESHLGKVLLYF